MNFFAKSLRSSSFVATRPFPRATVRGFTKKQDAAAAAAAAGTAAPAAAAPSVTKKRHINYLDVFAAYKRIQPYISKSPCDFSARLSQLTNTRLFLKKEHISITGSYKERGALNKLLTLTEEEKKRGVVCSSAGNHAQAVSYHTTNMGIQGIIVMPVTTPNVKVDATRRFGGRVVLHGEDFAEAYEKALEIANTEGRTFVHAFNDSDIVAGQGTCALELIEQNPYLDAVVVPIGGGGLIAGMSLALKHINPRIKVYGVEAKAMPGMYESMKQGKLVGVPKNKTIADGIAVRNVGDVPYDIVRKCVDEIILVDEDEIAGAILNFLEMEKTVVEGSGACGLAAILSGKLKLEGQTVATVLTGGNIDMTLLGRIIEKGLVKAGRLARIRVNIEDVPGQLAKICSVMAQLRANIQDIEHERAFLVENVGYTQPILTVETKGHEHIQEILQSLRENGFPRCHLDFEVMPKKV